MLQKIYLRGCTSMVEIILTFLFKFLKSGFCGLKMFQNEPCKVKDEIQLFGNYLHEKIYVKKEKKRKAC